MNPFGEESPAYPDKKYAGPIEQIYCGKSEDVNPIGKIYSKTEDAGSIEQIYSIKAEDAGPIEQIYSIKTEDAGSIEHGYSTMEEVFILLICDLSVYKFLCTFNDENLHYYENVCFRLIFWMKTLLLLAHHSFLESDRITFSHPQVRIIVYLLVAT